MTTNERLQDAAIKHAIELDRYSNHVVHRIIELLNKVDSDLIHQLADALERIPAGSFTIDRLERQLRSVRELNAKAFATVEKELTKELQEFSRYEAGYQLKLFRSVIPAEVVTEVGVASINANQAYAAAMARPMQGRLLKTWAAGIEAERLIRIKDAIAIGFTEGQTTDQIIRRIRGTRAKGYSDGVIDISRRHLASVVQTALGHIASTARAQFDEANNDLIKGYRWLSTLDNKTSEPCRIRDQLEYDRDKKPVGHKVPWLSGPGKLHWNCRSTETRILKSLRELGLDVDDFKSSTRASMNGQVPADTTYAEWLKDQPEEVQNDVLGKTRADLFRAGKVSFDRFYSDKGEFLTLADLRARGIS